MTSKRFWKGFAKGKYAVAIKDKNRYHTIIRLCNEKGLKWIQSTPKYESFSTFLNMCIIYEAAVDSLLCVDFDYCMNHGYIVIQSVSILNHAGYVECKRMVT